MRVVELGPQGLLGGFSRLHGRNPAEKRKSLSQKTACDFGWDDEAVRMNRRQLSGMSFGLGPL